VEIRNALPYGGDWLVTPYQLLGGDTPADRMLAVTWKVSATCFIPFFTLASREHCPM
jgi:hypothetical protein